MKRIVLLFLLNLLMLAGFSQSLQLFYEENVLEGGAEITLTAHADSGMASFVGLDVLNTGSVPLNIKCAREVITEVPGTENSFCWGLCYSATTDTSTIALKIDAGESSSSFSGDYLPGGYTGTTTVKYIFYDLANPDDQVTFILNYKATTESEIADHNIDMAFSPVYPNPANQLATIDYAANTAEDNVKFVLFDLFGSVVKEIEITEPSGSLNVNTSGLTEGIYFYSLLVNNESFLTQKLIIKH